MDVGRQPAAHAGQGLHPSARHPGRNWLAWATPWLVVVALALFRCAARRSVDVSCEGEVPVAVSVSVVALARPQFRPFSRSFLFLVGFVSLL